MTTYHCQLAKPYDPAKVKSWPVLVEPKMDGVRVLVRCSPDGGVEFRSRAWKPFTSFDHLIPAIKAEVARWHPYGEWECCDRCDTEDECVAKGECDRGGLPPFKNPNVIILDCEAVSETFNKAISQVRKKDQACTDVKLVVFDFFREGSGNRMLYEDRLAVLDDLIFTGSDVFSGVAWRRRCRNDDEVKAAYKDFRALGFEGAMVKDPIAPYELKRSLAWMKIKDKLSIDVPVTGTFPGKGKHKGRLGGLIVNVEGVECRVGTGLTDKQREDFQAAWDRDDKNRRLNPELRLEPGEIAGRLIEVEYHEMTPAGSLRHPRFIRFRDDKQETT